MVIQHAHQSVGTSTEHKYTVQTYYVPLSTVRFVLLKELKEERRKTTIPVGTGSLDIKVPIEYSYALVL